MTNGEIREEGERPGSREAGTPARRGGNRRVGGFLLLLLAICYVTDAAGGIYLSRRSTQEEPPQGLVYKTSVVPGDIPGESKEGRQREMDSLVEEGMLAMSMNITPSRKVSGRDRGINWLVENPSNQGKLVRVEITRDGTDEKIYETGVIRPGNHVESVPLDAELPAGVYECTAMLPTYRKETEAFIEQAAVRLTLALQE